MPENNITICIFAHNEEKNIVETICAIIDDKKSPFSVYIYANGCTDQTVVLCQKMTKFFPNVQLRESAIASKPLAWNAAFGEHHSEFIIFTDGDVVPEPNAANSVLSALKSHPEAVIATSRQRPKKKGLNFQQRVVGFLQLPLLHEYLYGGFYVVRRQALSDIMVQKGFGKMPCGITGEDCFLEFLLNPNQLVVSECNIYYEPPVFKDYFRYLARIRWQNEQLQAVYGVQSNKTKGCVEMFFHKMVASKDKRYLFSSVPAVMLRVVFKKIFSKKINSIYQSLGPITRDGAIVLNTLTRSNSTK